MGKILKILVSLLILSSPFGVVLRISPSPNIFIYPQDIIAGLIFLASGATLITKKPKLENKKLYVLLALFLLTGFVSLLINFHHLNAHSFVVSLAYLLRYASYASLILAMQLLEKDFYKKISKLLIFSGSFFVFLGFIQYFFYSSLRNLYYAGWDDHLYRLFSTFLDPNFAGAFLVLFIILLSEIILRRFKTKDKTLLGYSVIWLLTLIAILLTYSRSAFIMLVVGMVSLLLLHKRYKLLVGAVFGVFALYFLFSNRDIEGLNPFRMASVEARVESANDALNIISKNMIIGVGFNAYRYAQVRYGLRNESGALVSNADAGTDNSYLFVLATTGMIGFLFFIDFWISVFKVLIKRIKERNVYVNVTLASVVAILINSLFINSLFYAPIMAWVFILIGVSIMIKQPPKKSI